MDIRHALLPLALMFFSFGWNEEPPFYSTDLKHPVESAFVTSLEGAKTSIHLSVYALTDAKVMAALKKQAEAGVEVEVVADRGTDPLLAQKLGPKIKTTLLEGRGLMHHKITVIDGSTSWIGSANYTGESLRVHSNLMQKVFSQELSALFLKKMESLKNSGPKKKTLHQELLVEGQKFEVWFLPDDPDASLRIKELIRQAKKSIRVAMYTFTRLDFAETLVKAAQRGVKVEVILDRGMLEGASKKVREHLEKGPIKLYASRGQALLHHKMMVIDETILEHGSANFTKAAFTQNEDYFIVISDLTAQQKRELDLIWKSLIGRSKSL